VLQDHPGSGGAQINDLACKGLSILVFYEAVRIEVCFNTNPAAHFGILRFRHTVPILRAVVFVSPL
jgi:hypothetical protein